jgi:hypothetical protein
MAGITPGPVMPDALRVVPAAGKAARTGGVHNRVANNYVVDFNGADMNGDRNDLLEVMARSF